MLVKPLAMSNDSGLDRLMPIITTIIISSNSTIRNPVISETSRLEDRPELMRGITIVSAENFRKNKSQINNSFFKNQGNCGRSSAIHRPVYLHPCQRTTPFPFEVRPDSRCTRSSSCAQVVCFEETSLCQGNRGHSSTIQSWRKLSWMRLNLYPMHLI